MLKKYICGVFLIQNFIFCFMKLLTRFHYIQKKCYNILLFYWMFSLKKSSLRASLIFLFHFHGRLEEALLSLSSSDLTGLVYKEAILKVFICIHEGLLETTGKWPYWKYQLTFSLTELVAATSLNRYWKKFPLGSDRSTQSLYIETGKILIVSQLNT